MIKAIFRMVTFPIKAEHGDRKKFLISQREKNLQAFGDLV